MKSSSNMKSALKESSNKKVEGGIAMKQIIVMVAMVALGIALASFVMSFQTSAKAVVEGVQGEMTYNKIVTVPDSL